MGKTQKSVKMRCQLSERIVAFSKKKKEKKRTIMLDNLFFLPISKYLTGCRSANSMSPIVGIQIETRMIFGLLDSHFTLYFICTFHLFSNY